MAPRETTMQPDMSEESEEEVLNPNDSRHPLFQKKQEAMARMTNQLKIVLFIRKVHEN